MIKFKEGDKVSTHLPVEVWLPQQNKLTVKPPLTGRVSKVSTSVIPSDTLVEGEFNVDCGAFCLKVYHVFRGGYGLKLLHRNYEED